MSPIDARAAVAVVILAAAAAMPRLSGAQDAEEIQKKAMEQYQQMLKGVTTAPDPNARGGHMPKGYAGADQSAGMMGMAQNMFLSRIPLGAIAKASPGKKIGLKVEFEPGTMTLGVDRSQAPKSIKRFIKGDRYSLAGEVPVVSWKSGLAVQFIQIGPGTYDEYSRLLNGDMSLAEMQQAKERSKQRRESGEKALGLSRGFFTSVHDEESWAERTRSLQGQYEGLQREWNKSGSHCVKKPRALGGGCVKGTEKTFSLKPPKTVTLKERNDFLLKYGVPTPWKVGEELLSAEEKGDLMQTYGATVGGGKGGALELAKTYTAIAVVLKKPLDSGVGQPGKCLNRGRLRDGQEGLDYGGCDAVPQKLDPEKQKEYFEAYYLEFQTPGGD